MKRLVFALPLLALASCGSTSPAPSFKPLDYSYLPPILLKVSQVNVVNSYVPTPSQVQAASMDPAPPADTLMSMLKQRLQPAGQPGTATVTVQNAYVDNVNGNLVGAMTVDLNLASADGRSTGFTEASVSASQTAPDSGNADDLRAALYGLTKRLMTQMNVQLQYQIQKNMPNWISWTNSASTAAAAAAGDAGGAVQAAPLAAPPGVATAPASAAKSGGGNGVPNYLPGAGPATLGGTQQ
ncbi:hypothetical protein [Acidocella sp.]|uniref:hypothetical protein n=1 Tax=Acidocella sp. TaxID=50710 RepID=UPI003CFF1A20